MVLKYNATSLVGLLDYDFFLTLVLQNVSFLLGEVWVRRSLCSGSSAVVDAMYSSRFVLVGLGHIQCDLGLKGCFLRMLWQFLK